MQTEKLEDTANYTIEYDSEIDALVHTWDQFTAGQEFRDGCMALLDVIESRGANKLIIDTSGIQAHDDEDLQWLEEEWIPMEIEAGIEYSVSVHSDSIISEMEMEEFVDQTSDLPFTYVMASDRAEAREWIAEQ